MKIIGIVAEYNPFHNGHKYQIDQINKLHNPDGIVAVISGSFSQRGEPTILNKFQRAEIALANGVDLVLELPFIYSCQNSETFASGAIKILNAIGVTHLSFGAEDAVTDKLYDIAQRIIMPNSEYEKIFNTYMLQGESYIKSNERALLESNTLNETEVSILKKPNNILAIEYIKAIIKNEYKMNLLPISRHMVSHDEDKIENSFASSTKIREMVYSDEDISKLVPVETASVLSIAKTPKSDTLKSLIDYRLLVSKDSPSNLLDYEIGLFERARSKFLSSINYIDAIEAVHSKRITRSRVRRFLSNYLIFSPEDDFIRESLKSDETYLRVLGLNSIGAKIIKNSKNPIINRFRNIHNMSYNIEDIGMIELKANNVRSILSLEEQNMDYTISPTLK